MPAGLEALPPPPTLPGPLPLAGQVLAVAFATVVTASNASPIVVTTAAPHYLVSGVAVIISGVVGNTAANTTAVATVLTPTTFSIPVAGNGAYASGGTVTVTVLAQSVVIADPTTSANQAGVTAGGALKTDASATIQPVSMATLPLPNNAAQDGTDATGVNPPTGAVGIRGWLSGIYSKLSAALAVTQSGTWTVGTTGTDGSQATIGNTGDASTALTLVGLLKAIKAFLAGTLTVSGTVTANAGTGTMTVGQATGSNLHVAVDALPALPAGTNALGSVTANAGTNLNTSALATESGGNLATIATNTGKIPALGQAAMAASAPVAIANNQSAVPISAAFLPLPTGAATTAKQATLNAAGAATTAPAAARPAGIPHRPGITTADKLALPGTLTLSAVTEAGSTLPASALTAAVSAGNIYGVTGPGTIPGTITPVANQAVRMAWAQVTGATYYDLFLSTAAAPLWVARVTEAQRASGGFIVSVVGVVSAGSSAAGSIDIGIQGTGQATSAAPFAANTAYLPGNATLVNCAGYSRAHVLVDVALTDLRSAPALTVVPMLVGQVAGNWHAGKAQTIALLGNAGQALYQDYEIDVDGSTGLVVLVDSIAGQGTAVTINVELA